MNQDPRYAQVSDVTDEGFNFNPQKVISIVSTLVKDPKGGWSQVQGEFRTLKGLYLNFIIPLVAFSALCGFLKMSIIGIHVPFVNTVIREPVVGGVLRVIVDIFSRCIMLYVSAVILTKLAPKFSGATDEFRALKLLAFTGGISWIASVSILVPFIGVLLGLAAGIYGIYVLYQGITPMTGVPESQRLLYTVVNVITVVVLSFAFALITRAIVPEYGPNPLMAPTLTQQ